MRKPIPASGKTRSARLIALIGAISMALVAAVLMADVAAQDSVGVFDWFRIVLIFATTAWLGWGVMLALTGLAPWRARPVPALQGAQPLAVVLVPICNEDPVLTFARVAAIDHSIAAAGVSLDIAILSDTRDPEANAREREAFERLRREVSGQGRVFYRVREDGRGRKAGNVEDFIRRSGGAYEYAVILDADSLMSGAAIRDMIARMEADPDLGLLQTLPRIVGARSFFGRMMQFSAAFHGPVFTRGLARMQGATGPFWGHNAIVRVRAFAESCGLPALAGKPPFGGHILSHDYVEAALLARAGWRVEVDPAIAGSYEEGPENVLSHARRDRRWCQGNLQHIRLLLAPGLAGWSRFVFLQGIVAYLVSLLWAGFLLSSLAAAALAPPPDYFPEPYQLFPVFPSDLTQEILALVLGIVGLLILPKFAVWAEAVLTGRAEAYGGPKRALASVVTEIALTSLLAPVLLAYQTRAVLQVLAGQDGGWPANARGEGILHLGQTLRACLWVVVWGALAYVAVLQIAPEQAPWLLPVCLPMMLAPVLVAWTSRPLTHSVFSVPEEAEVPAVVIAFREIAARWLTMASPEDTASGKQAA
ncbi:glucans biosynthesis glucosyltransferase MdoH [Tropicimonas aquimaris]|uniref:Glucans biosynthesis glucosyltransferase H n=1 Tax=Tropicimonas aquimaris TaxID=914152 RepID=A0ABW3IQH8_9RHOB